VPRSGAGSPTRATSATTPSTRWPIVRRCFATFAVNSGLIDRVGFRDEAYARIAELVGAGGVSPDSGDADDETRAAPAVSEPLRSRHRPGRIASTIDAGPQTPSRQSPSSPSPVRSSAGRGGSRVLPFGSSSAGGDTVAAGLREAAADDSVSAIVLRVDSAGRLGQCVGNHLAGGEESTRARQAGGGVDGCGRRLRRATTSRWEPTR